MSDVFKKWNLSPKKPASVWIKSWSRTLNSFSRAQIQALIHEGLVMVNGRVAKVVLPDRRWRDDLG